MTECNRTHDTTNSAQRTVDSGLTAPPASVEPARLSDAEITRRNLAAPSATERRRWQVITLLSDETPLAEIIAATGYRSWTIREIAQRYRMPGAATLANRRAQRSECAL